MQEMKPCPFCGGKAKLVEDLYYDAPDIIDGGRNEDLDSFYVQCESCHMVPNSYGNDAWHTREAALTAWNTRPDQWISVEDELPGDGLSGTEDMSGVHVLISDGTGVSIGAFEWDECEWYCFGSVHVEVKWWQPLPPTPEGE